MLNRVACICLFASVLGLATGDAYAQKRKPAAAASKAAGKKGEPKADTAKSRPVDIELDEPGKVPSGPVTAGQMTEEAAQANAFLTTKDGRKLPSH